MSILSEEKDQRLIEEFFARQVLECVPQGENFRLVVNQFIDIQSNLVVMHCGLKDTVSIEVVSDSEMPAGYHEPTDTTSFFPWKIISSRGEFYFSGVYEIEPPHTEGGRGKAPGHPLNN